MSKREVWVREVDGVPTEVAATRAEIGEAAYGKVYRYVRAEPAQAVNQDTFSPEAIAQDD